MDFITVFWVGVGFGVTVLIAHLITEVPEGGGPMRYERWRAAFVMSRERRAAHHAAGMDAGNIPVSRYGMDAGGMDDPPPAAPDIDAVNAGMPRLSRDITDNEMIVLLAAQRGKDKKYRYSANAIHGLVGGDRNTVLATIKSIRDVPPPAEFRQPDGSTAPASHPITG